MSDEAKSDLVAYDYYSRVLARLESKHPDLDIPGRCATCDAKYALKRIMREKAAWQASRPVTDAEVEALPGRWSNSLMASQSSEYNEGFQAGRERCARELCAVLEAGKVREGES